MLNLSMVCLTFFIKVKHSRDVKISDILKIKSGSKSRPASGIELYHQGVIQEETSARNMAVTPKNISTFRSPSVFPVAKGQLGTTGTMATKFSEGVQKVLDLRSSARKDQALGPLGLGGVCHTEG